LILIASLGALYDVKIAEAVQQPDYSSKSDCLSATNDQLGELFFSPYLTGTSTLVSFKIQACATGSAVLKIFYANTAIGIVSQIDDTISVSSGSFYDISYPLSVSHSQYDDNGTKYMIRNNGGVGFRVLGSTASTSYTGGEISGGFTYRGALQDVYFYVDANSATSTATGTVFINQPLASSTVIEFPSWLVNYSISDVGQFDIYVFSASSSDLTFNNPALRTAVLRVYSPGNLSELAVPIPRPDVMCVSENDCASPTGTVWYARAEIRADLSGTIIASSSPISFNVLFNPGPVIEQDCSSGDLLCRAIRWLFYPSGAVLNRWTGLWSAVQNKPPFGYITSATGAIGSLATSTTSTFSLSPELAGLPFWDPIKNVISFLLYLTGIFWLFNRARHIQL